MHFDELTAPEQRVLGCLIEKRWTTPDQYPLSLNALRTACNQSTNRDPVTSLDEDTVYRAAQRLCQYGLARLASGHSSRTTKYRHLAEEGLGLERAQLAVLAVLLLRGPQTPGELKTRTERLAAIASLEQVDGVLGELAQRDYVRNIGRRPGQKEDRFVHLLGGADSVPEVAAPLGSSAAGEPASPAALSTAPPPTPVPAAASPALAAAPAPAHTPAAADSAAATEALAARVAALEAEVARLRAQLDELLA